MKTILENSADEERQTVKGVGQLKYYKYSIVHKQMGFSKIKEVLVFSHKPNKEIIDFCLAETIRVIWKNGNYFQIFNVQNGTDELFNPDNLI